ncbi:unnamed protein product [Debaryomyces tyrocola]|nr:unnamed protein product [Debaryomyces tyrocola]
MNGNDIFPRNHNFDISKSTKSKRTRVPTSCLLCRKRKIKCDRKRPYCSGCLTNNTSHLCKYEIKPWSKEYFDASNKEPWQEEIEDLRLKIKSLEKNIEQQQLELDTRSGTSLHSSVTSVNSSNNDYRKGLDERDTTILDLAERFDCLIVKDLRLRYFGPTSSVALIRNDKHASAIYSKYFKGQHKKFNEITANHGDLRTKKYNDDGEKGDCSSYRPSFVGDFPELPSSEVIDLLLRRFFDFCYPLFPFIDEKSFRADIKVILTKEYNSINLNIHQESTFALFLVMLRYAYITLPFKDNSNRLSETKFDLAQQIALSETNIPPSYVEYAKHLIISPNGLGKMTLRTIQAGLFLRVYKKQCPEDDDIATDNEILLGILIQMARFHGFHRNAVGLDKDLVNADDIQLWKKIWTQLLYLDAMQSFANGTPLLVSDDEFNNQRSFITYSDCFNLQSEETLITRQFALSYMATKMTRKFLLITSQMYRSFKRSALDELVVEMNELIYNKMRTFDQLCNSDGNIIDENITDRAQEFMLRMELFLKSYTLNYILFLTANEEREADLRKSYLMFALEKALIISKLAFEFAENTSSKFGSELETFIAPYIWTPLYKILPTLYSILLRVNAGEFSLIEFSRCFKSPDSAGLIAWAQLNESENKCVKNLVAIYEQLNSKCLHLSFKFFHCYRVCFTFKIIFNYLQEFYPQLLTPSDGMKGNAGDIQTKEVGISSMQWDDFWNNKLDPDRILDFDYFYTNMQYNLDPFLNDLNTSFNIFEN